MLDDRDAYTPGWKFAEWELRGVPLRLEIGPKDIEKSQVVLARRDTREKAPAAMDGLAAHVTALLDEIQKSLFARALTFREEHTTRVASYDEFKSAMEGRPGFVIAAWCGSDDVRGARSKPKRRRRCGTSRSAAKSAGSRASNAASRRLASRGSPRRISQAIGYWLSAQQAARTRSSVLPKLKLQPSRLTSALATSQRSASSPRAAW